MKNKSDDSDPDYGEEYKTKQRIAKRISQQKRRANPDYRKKENSQQLKRRIKQRPITKYINENISTAKTNSIIQTHSAFGHRGYKILKNIDTRIDIEKLNEDIKKERLNWKRNCQTTEDSLTLSTEIIDYEKAQYKNKFFENELNGIIKNNIGNDYQAFDMVIVKSLKKDCGKKHIHYDYDPRKVDEYKTDYPVCGILAFHHNTKLQIYKNGSINKIESVSESQIKDITIEKGDILLYIGYLPHRDSQCDEDNISLHFVCKKVNQN
ncbi:hypothetical protein ROZALSC1DRAFT_30588 [Rozella allomycis CSF55]|uniref:Uncharacterized protein n=1 Tax=Rozella allomycis (strain CSF55) TaxID=988480 RepID=A0A075AV31_ROZAC|nr:hypothetical protein O9G_003750 [Rozella allomycis CSF55]RKP17630.1 hypothetical protein ROZALSC1DRAFT_30588 [Rozella allomycis CSF55]|eukprot:EPZ34151.1 hypothetical protein O9G_003750 [Rozella allomycis CSF55]